MKIKTTELTGPALDWAVAQCKGETFSPLASSRHYFAPSKLWAQGGPIIEKEGIEINKGGPLCLPSESGPDDSCSTVWVATIDLDEGDEMVERARGRTPLEASMRCYVLSMLGEYVDVPDALAPELAA